MRDEKMARHDDTPNGRKLKSHEVREGSSDGSSSLFEKGADSVRGLAKTIFAAVSEKLEGLKRDPVTHRVASSDEPMTRIIPVDSEEGQRYQKIVKKFEGLDR